MTRLFCQHVFLGALLASCPFQVFAQGPIYVSPSGSDKASGLSPDTPLQTISKARSVVRELGDDWRQDITVLLMPGKYYLEKTILFSKGDGGKGGRRLIFRNYGPLGSAELYGGRPLSRSGWQKGENGVYTHIVERIDDIHSIYENGRRSRKARFPNHEHLDEFPTSDGAYFLSKRVSKNTPYHLMPKTSDIGRELLTHLASDLKSMKLYLVVWGHGRADWHKWVFPVHKIAPEPGQIIIDDDRPDLHKGKEASRNRYYLEGARRFLDADGEFFYDTQARVLHYKPYGDPAQADVIVSTVKSIVRVEETGNILLEGLSFKCSAANETFPGGYTWNDPSAAVSLVKASGVTIRNCRFQNTGQSAVNMKHSSDNTVTGCVMSQLGQSGIKLEYSDRNEISNCVIHDIGLRTVYCEGVAVHSSRDNTIRHLEIYNSARYGITLRARVDKKTGLSGRPTTGNVLEYIKMHDVNQDSGDTAGLHMAMINYPAGPNYTNTCNQITIHRSIAQPDITDEWKPTGVYLDHPKAVMNQSLNNIEVTDYDPRYTGYDPKRFGGIYGPDPRTNVLERQIMQNRPHNNSSSTKFNCSWSPDFDKTQMEYEKIGLTSEFPAEYRND